MTTVKILIVDNNAGNLVALETCLQKLDAELVHAVNAEEALQHLLLHDFSLAIIDISVPDMDGYNLASLIHQNKQTRELPIIFLSTVFSDDIDFCESYSSGTVDFITKPFNPGILIAKVSIFLQMHLQRLKLKENILQLRVNENQILLQNKLLKKKLSGTISRAFITAGISTPY